MNPQDVDTLIETAARQMIAGDPPAWLDDRVMARVRERAQPRPRPCASRIRFASAVMLTVLVAATFILNRAPAPAPQLPVAFSAMEPAAVVQPPVTPIAQSSLQPDERPSIWGEAEIARPPLSAVVSPIRAFEDVPTTSSIEPLVTEPIVVSALDLPPIETDAMTIDAIEIDDITIEPLTASND